MNAILEKNIDNELRGKYGLTTKDEIRSMRRAVELLKLKKGKISQEEYREFVKNRRVAEMMQTDDLELREEGEGSSEAQNLPVDFINVDSFVKQQMESAYFDEEIKIKFNKERFKKMQTLGQRMEFSNSRSQKYSERRECCRLKQGRLTNNI